MRDVEKEIDSEIRALPIWKKGRVTVLEGLMGVYRDAVECAHLQSLDAGVFENTDVFQTTLGIEDGIRGGALWSLKWATEYCPDAGSDAPLNEQDLVKAIRVGWSYDALVDALKSAKHNLVTLSVDRESREIICYEGEIARDCLPR